MSVYFLDTSALVKRYVTEQGSEWVTALCESSALHSLVMSQATFTEAIAALCRKARHPDRSQRISEAVRDHLILLFRRHALRQYTRIQVTQAIYTHAGELCRTHPLRAYDAIQLACALKARFTPIAMETNLTFVSADGDLLHIAQAEGIVVENPNMY